MPRLIAARLAATVSFMERSLRCISFSVALMVFNGNGGQLVAASCLPDCPGHIGSLELPTECMCTKKAQRIRPFNVQGCDIYAWWSNICMAAVHSGVTPRDGGPVRIEMREPQSEFVGCLRNNMFSNDYRASDLPTFVVLPIEEN